MALETFTWQVEIGASGDVTQRVRVQKFADGYSQAVEDGLNNKEQSWAISHTGSEARIREIIAFFDRHKGSRAFLWTPPLGELGLYKANGYKPTPKGGTANTVTATFEQTFQP